ncbi:LysR family transcriptional regulator [Piscinibacter sp.]|uniref:LysR family transcriptional regulator n=1 Tax=Piscinibacter sp. TaxID=1903157 RepID=UPI003559D5A8
MDPLRRMAAFATVVEQRSMSAAARALGMSTSAVSQQVRQLERDSGVTLLHRSTRKLTLTAAGERFYAGCAAMVAAAREAQQQLAQVRDAPTGELRVSAPVGFARHVAQALSGLLGANPGLTLRLLVDDQLIDLIEERIDLALRFGRLADSSWAARKLCEFERLVCAAPAYLRRRGLPATAADLASHDWLQFATPGGVRGVELTDPDGAAQTLRVDGRISSNNQYALQQMCLAGLGVAALVHPDVADDLNAGRLVDVLPRWRVTPLVAWAVTPQRDTQPAKVRYAVDALQSYLSALPGAHV